MRSRMAWLAALALAPAGAGAADGSGSYVRPSFSVQGVSEHGSGAAFTVPGDDLDRALGVCLGAGLDGRGQWADGAVDWSAFGFVNDPTPDGHGGLFAAARARGTDALGGAWRLRFDASGRVQRRETTTLSDFARSDLSMGLERQGRVTLGARVGDRRRSAREDTLGFDRQSLLVAATWGAPGGHRFRVELGPQRAHARTAVGSRASGTVEWAARAGAWTTAVRATWLEPFGARRRDVSGGSFQAVLPTAFPAPTLPPPTLPPTPTVDPPAPDATVRAATPAEGLLGPALMVDPLEDDENDWDIGLRKQQLVFAATRAFGRATVSAELRADIERGPDLLSPTASTVARERLAARLTARRTLGPKWALLAQGGWQQLDDDRPGRGYSHGLVSFGVELRP
ncbi:MAG: hypothetical protein ABW221_14975 [Vicinamibacteria bacterium]